MHWRSESVWQSHEKANYFTTRNLCFVSRNAALIKSFQNIQVHMRYTCGTHAVHMQSDTSSHAVFWQDRTQWTVLNDLYVFLCLLNCLFYTNSIHPWARSKEPLITHCFAFPFVAKCPEFFDAIFSLRVLKLSRTNFRRPWPWNLNLLTETT